jgi:hypothetical protein
MYARACVVFTCTIFAAALARPAASQDLEPRAYVNTPVGLNFLLAGAGYTDGSVVLHTSAPIEDAEIESYVGFLAYVRSLDVFGRSAKIGLIVPFADASGTARVAGRPRHREISGLGDPHFRFSVNFIGAPALSLQRFAEYEQDLIIGTTLEVSAPIGQYDSAKLLNIGTNRWSVKQELGVSKAWDRWALELSSAVLFFTDNDDFLGGRKLEQRPIHSVQGHVIVDLWPGSWASFDATYYFGGATVIDGVKGSQPENARVGLTVSLPLSRQMSVKLYGSTGIYSRTGTEFDAIGLVTQFRW